MITCKLLEEQMRPKAQDWCEEGGSFLGQMGIVVGADTQIMSRKITGDETRRIHL